MLGEHKWFDGPQDPLFVNGFELEGHGLDYRAYPTAAGHAISFSKIILRARVPAFVALVARRSVRNDGLQLFGASLYLLLG